MTSHVRKNISMISIKVQRDSIEIEDGRIFSESFMKIREYKDSKKFCDVVFCVPNNGLGSVENNESLNNLYGHSCIIASCSTFIYGILSSHEISMKQQKRLVFQDIEYNIMKQCLNFMYGMKVKIDYSELHKLKAAAELLGIDSLVKHCKLTINILLKNGVEQSKSNKSVPESKECHQDENKALEETIPVIPLHLQNIHNQSESAPNEKDLHMLESNSNFQEIKTESNDVTNDNLEEVVLLKNTEELASDDNNQEDDNSQQEKCPFIESETNFQETKSAIPLGVVNTKSKIKPQININHKSKRVKKYANLKEKNRALTEMGRKPRPCNHCGVMYKNYRALRKHMKEVNGDVLTCQYCPKKFFTKSSLTCHEKRHKEEKNFKCELCEFRAVTKVEVEWHMSSHNNLPGAICDLCGKSFKRKRTLKIHMIQVHGESAQLYECPSCSYTHPSFGVLKYHMIRHQKQGTEICTVCGKIYKRKHSLKEHMKVAHNSELFDINDTSHLLIATEVVEEDATAILSQDDSSHIYTAVEYPATEAVVYEGDNNKDVDQQLIAAARNCDDMDLTAENAGRSQNISEYGQFARNIDEKIAYEYQN